MGLLNNVEDQNNIKYLIGSSGKFKDKGVEFEEFNYVRIAN